MPANVLRSSLFTLSFILLALLLQTAGAPGIAYFGLFPDLLLILLCLTGIFKGPVYGGISGGVIGFLLGMINRHFIVTFFLWLALGSFFGLLKSDLFNNLPVLAGASCLLGTLFINFLYLIFSALLLKEPFYLTYGNIILKPLLNGLTAFLLFPLFRAGLSIAP